MISSQIYRTRLNIDLQMYGIKKKECKYFKFFRGENERIYEDIQVLKISYFIVRMES